MRHERAKYDRSSDDASASRRSALRAFSCSLCVLFITACTDNHAGPTTRPLTMEEKQAQLMADPFGYKTDTPNTDISGGDLTHFDKDAMKKDVDHVFNP